MIAMAAEPCVSLYNSQYFSLYASGDEAQFAKLAC